MIFEIGNIIKQQLEPLVSDGSSLTKFIDKLAGVVKVLSKQERNADNTETIIKTFPVSCDITFEDCIQNGSYKDLIPNSKLGCIVYLEEDDSLDKINEIRGVNFYKTSYRIVGWLNQKKLGTNDCSITGKIVNTIISKLQQKQFNSGIYQQIDINVIGQDQKSYNPFAKYSYDEDATKYLMAPFDYFSIKIEVTVGVNVKCIEPFEKQTPILCNS